MPEAAPTSAPPASADTATDLPLIEIGWVMAGRLARVDVQAIQAARVEMLRYLRAQFPDFAWRMPLVHRNEFARSTPEEPVRLLDLGVQERDARRWDYAFVVTDADLRSYYKPFAFGAPSQAISVAVLSTGRIDPADADATVDDTDRIALLARRLVALGLHLFGHLNDLDHTDTPDDYMYDLHTVEDLDRMTSYSEARCEQLLAELHDVADVRLEESESYRGREVLFYLRAMWLGREDIAGAVGEIRPWQFPFRFSKLTTAAASTMTVLVITAEAWDLGMSQPAVRVAAMSLVALLGTSVYILVRQRLLKRRRIRLAEQRVVSNAAISLAVLIGMATTYALLFGTTLLLALTFFSMPLVEGWAASIEPPIRIGHYLVLAGFVASLGILIGALGATFEEEGYFRHVAFVNEET